MNLPKRIQYALYLLTAGILFKLFNRLDADYDLWFHIFFGNKLIDEYDLVRFDNCSFTAFGQPFINHEWLAEIIMAMAYKIGGDIGLIIWHWIMAAMIIWLSLTLINLKAKNYLSKITIILCAAVVLSPGMSFRVQLFSYLSFLILLNIIYFLHTKNKFLSLAAVTMLFLIWANLHGAFVFGLLLWWIYLTEGYCLKQTGNIRYLFLAYLLPVAVTLINPFGFNLWKYIYSEICNPLNRIFLADWQPFSFAIREMPFFIVMSIAWLAYFCSARKKRIAETITMMLATIMAIMAVRNTPLFIILALPSLATHIDGSLQRLFNKTAHGEKASIISTNIAAILFVITATIFFVMGTPENWKIKTDKDPLPLQTVALIKQNNFAGNLWVPLHWGSYVLFHLHPEIKVSIDGRWSTVYPLAIRKEQREFAYGGTNGKWKNILTKYGADFALIEPDNPAIKEMTDDPEWIWAFYEQSCGLLMRKTYLELLDLPLKVPEKRNLCWP